MKQHTSIPARDVGELFFKKKKNERERGRGSAVFEGMFSVPFFLDKDRKTKRQKRERKRKREKEKEREREYRDRNDKKLKTTCYLIFFFFQNAFN